MTTYLKSKEQRKKARAKCAEVNPGPADHQDPGALKGLQPLHKFSGALAMLGLRQESSPNAGEYQAYLKQLFNEVRTPGR